MADLTSLSLTEMQAGLQAGDFSSRELVQAALDRIAQLDGSLHAFLHVAVESALVQADGADRQRDERHGGNALPLLGIPLAVKDVLTPTVCGCAIVGG